MSLKKKIILVIGIILIIMFGIGMYSIVTLKSVNNQSTIMAEEIIPELSKAENFRFTIARYRSTEFKHITIREIADMDKAEADMDEYAKIIDESLSDMNTSGVDGINEIISNWESYKTSHKDFIVASRNMDSDLSFSIMMGDLKTYYDAMSSFAEKRVEQMKQSAADASLSGDRNYAQARLALIVILIISMLFGTIAGLILIRAILVPINKFKNELTVLSESGGDLTKTIDVKSKDEMGQMGNALNKFIQNIREIIVEVNQKADSVLSSSDFVRSKVEVLSGNISDSSATIEQLSAGMEETAASSEEVSSSSEEIMDVVSSLADKATQGANAVVDISARASELKNNSEKAQEVAVKTYDSSRIQLEKAIKRSEAIEEINVLSNSILQISNQTNLLALNASIEAARAGEAGRGFAVVASEIGHLADDSKSTVSEIQKITGEVIEAVKDLSDGAKRIIEFIDFTVLNDYKNFVKVGESYGKDAEFVDELVTDISATSEELTATIESIMKAIEDVATAMNEGATGTQEMAKRMMEITQIGIDVDRESRHSSEQAVGLKNTVGKFIV